MLPLLGLLPIIGPIINKVIGVVDKVVPDSDLNKKLKAELEKSISTMDHEVITKEIDARAKIIVGEISSESWLARMWRPIIMLLFGAIIANNYILNPWISVLFDVNIVMEVPPQMWQLLKLGLTGYVVGRSVEKGIKLWKGR